MLGTWTRKEVITEEDLETQLLSPREQERTLQIELTEMRLLTGNRAERLKELAELFRTRFSIGWQGLNTKPKTSEAAEQQFKAKRKIIQTIVNRINIDNDKDVEVIIDLDIREALTDSQLTESEKVCISDPEMCRW